LEAVSGFQVGTVEQHRYAIAYVEYLERRTRQHPEFSLFKGPHFGSSATKSNDRDRLFDFLTRLAEILGGNRRIKLDEALEELTEYAVDHDLSVSPPGKNERRQLVFTVFGWITSLYNPHVQFASTVLQVEEESADSFERPKQSIDICKRSFEQMVHGFGKIFPGKWEPALDVSGNETGEDMLQVGALNMAHLKRVKGLEIQWVHSIGAHLDLDKSKKVLKLFCFPSFFEMHRGNSGVVQEFGTSQCFGRSVC
jgi:hypothetical protein